MILGFGVIFFLILSVATVAFAAILWAVDCHCIETGRLMGFALMFAGASNICLFAGLVAMRKTDAVDSSSR